MDGVLVTIFVSEIVSQYWLATVKFHNSLSILSLSFLITITYINIPFLELSMGF